MSSIGGLLNPSASKEDGSEFDGMEMRPMTPGSPPLISPAAPASPAASVDNMHYRASAAEHKIHTDCPDTLACLPDTDERPQHTLPVILRCAILGSPRRRLTIREIYAAMESKYPYYKTAGPTWRQSVRHHLSLNRLFERQARPVTDPGFGSYWTVNLEAPPGTKRPRKRGRAVKEQQEQKEEEMDNASPPPKRAKAAGRPAKLISAPAPERPTSALRSGGGFDEDEEDEDAEHSEGEYESEDEMSVVHRDGRTTMRAFGAPPAHSHPLPQQSFSMPYQSTSALNESYQAELTSLRRQTQDALSMSMRINEQLNEAHAATAKIRSDLRTSEASLAEEKQKRFHAERIAEDESRARRAAEEALRQFQQRGP